MPIRIIKSPIQVFRKGATVELKVGTEFDFTEAELADIKAVNPRAIEHPVVEDKAVVAEAKAAQALPRSA